MKSWRERQGIRTIMGLYTNQKARRDSAPINERPIGTFSVLWFAFVSANDWERDTSHDYQCNSAWGTCEISMYFLSQFFFFQRLSENPLFNRVMRIGSKHPVLINLLLIDDTKWHTFVRWMFHRATVNSKHRQTSTQPNIRLFWHAHEVRSDIQLQLQLQIDRQNWAFLVQSWNWRSNLYFTIK